MAATSMYFPIRFKTHVQLAPSELTESFVEVIASKLKAKFEGVCSRFGYVKPGTLALASRSAGSFMKPHFNGHTRFEVCVMGDVCNPTTGMVVDAKVKASNNLGVLADGDGILDILIPRRSAGISSEVDLDGLKVGDDILVEVLGKRYQLKDSKISIIGRVVKERKNPLYYTDILDDGGSVDGGAEGGDEGDAEVSSIDGEGDSESEDDDEDGVGKVVPKTVLNADARKLLAALRPEGGKNEGVEEDEEEEDEVEEVDEEASEDDEKDDWE
jgi:DNA-directed RNA polymerase subunit E'/Rpb7